jgi:RND family efflux transporter MFP subunit
VLSVRGYTPEESPRFAGRVEAGDSAQLAFRVAGQIRHLNVHMGEVVEQGAVLAELDPTDYLLNLEAREAEYEVARLAAERSRSLHRRQLISEDQFDTAQTRLATTRARLEQAREQLSYSKLIAPFEGNVAFTYAMPSEVVAAQQPVLTLQDTRTLDIRFNLPPRYQPLLSGDTPASFKVEFDLMPGVLHQARFQEVSLQPDRDTNSYRVTLVVDDPEDFTLRPGMSVSVRLYHVSFQAGRWALPEEALFDRSGTTAHVWRIDADEQRVHKTAITLDESGYLLEGLAPGDRIVAAGVARLSEGQVVQPWVREGGL